MNTAKVAKFEALQSGQRAQVRDLHLTIAQRGGDRLTRIGVDIDRPQLERARRQSNATRYEALRRELGMLQVANPEDFQAQKHMCLQWPERSNTAGHA